MHKSNHSNGLMHINTFYRPGNLHSCQYFHLQFTFHTMNFLKNRKSLRKQTYKCHKPNHFKHTNNYNKANNKNYKFTYGSSLKDFNNVKSSSGWCGSVDWALACKQECCRFDSWSAHMPGLQVMSPVGDVWEAIDQRFSHTSFSLSLSLPFSLKINKLNLLKKLQT